MVQLDGEARRALRSRCRSRCRASAAGSRAARRSSGRRRPTGTSGRAATPGWMYLALLGAGLHRLARAAAEDLRRARRPRGAARRRPERARPAALRGRAAAARHRRARRCFPTCRSHELALPMILMHGAAAARRRLGLAAVFSAEISAADAVLFMLTTSLSQDLYKRFLNPAADGSPRAAGDARARRSSAASSALALAIVSPTSSDVTRRLLRAARRLAVRADSRRPLSCGGAGTPEALASIGCGVATMVGGALHDGRPRHLRHDAGARGPGRRVSRISSSCSSRVSRTHEPERVV